MEDIVFRAGKKALEIIRDGGLTPDRITTVAGAAGGPKWLVLRHLDRVLFSQWFKGRQKPLFLMGSSIGAWRFACQCMSDPLTSLANFETAYIHQTYVGKPSPEAVTRESLRIQRAVLTPRSIEDIFQHPFLRLNFMTVRSKGLLASDNRPLLTLSLLAVALANLASRSTLKFSFERALFHDPRDIPPFYDLKGFDIHHVPLTARNLAAGLLASGSIPLVMSGVRDIAGAPAGVYRDGGVIDYHLDISFSNNDDGLTLFPHYVDRVIPGWLDKPLKWRVPSESHMENVLMVAPSRRFVEKLPYHKIPDRNDFYKFEGADTQRFDYWKQTVNAGQVLADAFMEAVSSGRISRKVVPMFASR